MNIYNLQTLLNAKYCFFFVDLSSFDRSAYGYLLHTQKVSINETITNSIEFTEPTAQSKGTKKEKENQMKVTESTNDQLKFTTSVKAMDFFFVFIFDVIKTQRCV